MTVENNDQVTQTQEDSQKKDSVAYETHQKLLAQRKRDQEILKEMNDKLAKFEEAERLKEQKELESKGQYSKILEEREKRIRELEDRFTQQEQKRVNQEKEAAFLQALPGKLRNQSYLSFMDKEGIVIDPETGKVDEGTLKQTVDKFLKEHSALVDTKQNSSQNIPQSKAPSDPKVILNGNGKVDALSTLANMIVNKK